jgi:hypothetical protein
MVKKRGRTVADAGAGTQHMHGSTGVAAVVVLPRVQMHEAFTVRPSVWLVQQLLQSAAWNLLTESRLQSAGAEHSKALQHEGSGVPVLIIAYCKTVMNEETLAYSGDM